MHSATTITTSNCILSTLLNTQVVAIKIPFHTLSFDANEKGSYMKSILYKMQTVFVF